MYDERKIKKKRIRKKKIIILSVFFIVIFLIGIMIFSGIAKTKEKKRSINENLSLQEKLSSYIKKTSSENTNETEYKIDFKELKKIYPDLIGYL